MRWRQTLFIQGFYAFEHGSGRDQALEFFVDMRKNMPYIFAIARLVDFRGNLMPIMLIRFTEVFVDRYLSSKTPTLPGLRKVAIPPYFRETREPIT